VLPHTARPSRLIFYFHFTTCIVLSFSLHCSYKPTLSDVCHVMGLHIYLLVAVMMYSVGRLATGWTVGGSNSGGERGSTCHPDRPQKPPSLYFNGYQFFRDGKQAGAWYWKHTFLSWVANEFELYFCPLAVLS